MASSAGPAGRGCAAIDAASIYPPALIGPRRGRAALIALPGACGLGFMFLASLDRLFDPERMRLEAGAPLVLGIWYTGMLLAAIALLRIVLRLWTGRHVSVFFGFGDEVTAEEAAATDFSWGDTSDDAPGGDGGGDGGGD